MRPASAHFTAHYDVVSGGVHGQTGDDGRARDQLLGQLLLRQVVDAHAVLGGHEKEGLGGVEGCPDHLPLVLPEGVLSRPLAQLVHQHCLKVTIQKGWQAGKSDILWKENMRGHDVTVRMFIPERILLITGADFSLKGQTVDRQVGSMSQSGGHCKISVKTR